jgi:hypothetical protein
MRYDLDMLPTKPTTDIVLHGHAYAPKGEEHSVVEVTLQVGRLSKSLQVTGDRVYEKSLLGNRLTPPAGFLKLPLVYERAYGGVAEGTDPPRWEMRNPVGTGYATDAAQLIGKKAPNIEYARQLFGGQRPAGFGPIAYHWAPRIKYAGTYDEKWEQERMPLLPRDFQERFYQSAPEDQQTPSPLRGGESVELTNLTPSGFLRFQLPRIKLVFYTNIAGKVYTHRASLHTVALEPDQARVLLTWHTSVPCHNRSLKIGRINVRQKEVVEKGQPANGH